MSGTDELAVFCAVAETGGFSAAARRLEMSKSAVSKTVRKLENRLGANLFHRTTRRISLSEAGETYYNHARLAMRQLEAARDAVTSLRAEPQGRLRMTAPMSMGLTRIADVVADFLDHYPKMSVDLHLDDGRVDLIGGGFDLAIRVGELPDSTMVARPIGKMPALLVASPAYVEKHGAPATPEEVAEHECLLYSHAFDNNTWQFTGQDGHTERIAVTGRYKVNSSIALRRAVLGGLGISRIPQYLIKEDLENDRLVHLLPDYDMDSATIHAVYPEPEFIPQRARLFVEFVTEALAE